MAIDYVDAINLYTTHADLLELARNLDEVSDRLGWAAGRGFEHIILRAFQIEGADVTWPYPVNLGDGVNEQIDGAIYYEWLHCVIESKDYSSRINFEPIAKLRTQLARRPPGTLGLVFAKSGFTASAVTLTRMTNPANILLWEYAELEYALENAVMLQGLIQKFRFAVERGVPDYNIIPV